MTTRGTYAIIDFAVRDTRETEHSNVRVAQLDRASGYGPEGREFESSRARTRDPCLTLSRTRVFCCSEADVSIQMTGTVLT